MNIKCPVCETEYEEGTIRFCSRCMYSIGADVYLTNLLNHPSNEELRLYNLGLEEFRALWKQRMEQKEKKFASELALIEVKGGTFFMGSDSRDSCENPKHQVTVSNFWIAKIGVTCSSFADFISDTGYQTDADKNGGSYIWTGNTWENKNRVNWESNIRGEKRGVSEKNHPVVHVSWNDAVQFCNWRSQKEGLQPAFIGTGDNLLCDFESGGYRLPTEAEWEYASRGGNKGMGYKYSGSNNLDEVAWYEGNSNRITHEAAMKQANELGIFDMSGNVWEWCWDWRAEYRLRNQTNPRGSSTGTVKVTRGGSWRVSQEFCRVDCRGYCLPNDSCSDLGFRLARR